MLFSGADLWTHGGFAHAGLLWAPAGLDQSGFVLKLLAGAGTYRYRSDAIGADILGTQFIGSALPGWKIKGDSGEVTIFAGLDVQDHRFRPEDAENRLNGTHIGLRVGADVWYEPFKAMMLTASVSGSTIGPSYWTRVAVGWRLFDMFWVGPEVLAMGDRTYNLFQAGIHITALRLGR